MGTLMSNMSVYQFPKRSEVGNEDDVQGKDSDFNNHVRIMPSWSGKKLDE